MREWPFKPSPMMTYKTVKDDWERFIGYIQKSSQKKHLQFELKDVKQCDSAGLALLIAAQRLCKKNNKVFCLENIPKDIYDLTQFCGVSTILFAHQTRRNKSIKND